MQSTALALATIVAIILGPIVALWLQRISERRRDQRNRKLVIFKELMATRATRLSPRHVDALNAIEVEFSDGSQGTNAYWRRGGSTWIVTGDKPLDIRLVRETQDTRDVTPLPRRIPDSCQWAIAARHRGEQPCRFTVSRHPCSSVAWVALAVGSADTHTSLRRIPKTISLSVPHTLRARAVRPTPGCSPTTTPVSTPGNRRDPVCNGPHRTCVTTRPGDQIPGVAGGGMRAVLETVTGRPATRMS